MKLAILATSAAIALSAPAAAKDITLTLNDTQQQALLQVLDRATRDGGLTAATNGTTYFFKLLKDAVDAANAPAPAQVKPNEPGGQISKPVPPAP